MPVAGECRREPRVRAAVGIRMRTFLPCLLLLAPCGASTPAPAAPCDSAQCLVDTFNARGTTTYRVQYTTDEGDPISYTYKVDGGVVEVVIDDSADDFSGDPGI